MISDHFHLAFYTYRISLITIPQPFRTNYLGFQIATLSVSLSHSCPNTLSFYQFLSILFRITLFEAKAD